MLIAVKNYVQDLHGHCIHFVLTASSETLFFNIYFLLVHRVSEVVYTPRVSKITPNKLVVLTLSGLREGIFHPQSFLDQILSAEYLSEISKLFWR